MGAVIVDEPDITERSRAEDELRETTEALRTLFQASPLAIVELSLEGRILRRNPAAQKIFGYTDEEVLGKAVPLRSAREREKFAGWLAEVTCGNLVDGVEAEVERKDGTKIEIRVVMAPLRNSEGKVSGAVALVGDVTEARRTERGLRTSEARYRVLFERNLAGVFRTSEVGDGTVFRIYPRDERSGEHTRKSSLGEAATRGSETVMVVEDEEAVRESTCEYLASRGYRVLQAANGNDALNALERFTGRIDLLITDVFMPGMSGADLAQKVREQRPEIRVLYVSGYTESDVVQHGVDAGSGFLQKPFTLTSLGRKVREVVDPGAARKA